MVLDVLNEEEFKGFINIDRHNKTEKLSEDEQKEIIRKLQWKTGEQWKPFVLTYFISEKGKVYTATKNRLIKPAPNKQDGYLVFTISLHGKTKPVYIHRIVNALFNYDTHYDPIGLFCGAYDTFDTHHCDFDKTNNTPNNLVWVDHRLHRQIHREVELNIIDKSEINTVEKFKAYEAKKIKEKQRERDIETMYDNID